MGDLPPIHKSHLQTTPEAVACIQELALRHPAYGCNRLEAMLALEGRQESSITIQKILNDNGLHTRTSATVAIHSCNCSLKSRSLRRRSICDLANFAR